VIPLRFAFVFPYPAIALAIAGSLAYILGIKKLARPLAPEGHKVRLRDVATPAEIRLFFLGLLILVLLEAWPAVELARYVSALAYLTHNILILLVAVPLMLRGLPRWLAYRLTEFPVVDDVISLLTRPVIATMIYFVVLVGSMTPFIVEQQATSTTVFIYLQVMLVFGAIVMWLPAMRLVPGVATMSIGARVVYIFAQSLLPAFPGFILIFSHHTFYPIFAQNSHLLGISGVADQELAGGVDKTITFGILWIYAFAIMGSAQSREDAGQDPEPITWMDVQREFERNDRRPRHRR